MKITICELCIQQGLPLQIPTRTDPRRNHAENYCLIPNGLGPLEGTHRQPNPHDTYNPNYTCTYHKTEENTCPDSSKDKETPTAI